MARWQPERADVIADYAREVLAVHPRGRLLVGVDGIELPVETAEPPARQRFAQDLAASFRAKGVQAEAVRMADYAVDGATDPAAFFDVGRFRAEVLAPYRAGRRAVTTPSEDGWIVEGPAADRQVLVVEGPFLHFGELAGMWHTSAWTALSRREARQRDADRLGVPADLPEVDAWYRLVDLAFRRLDARKLANATFDLTDPAHPHREFEDAC